jgi:hypothetical protein
LIGFDSAWISDSRERLCDFPSKKFRFVNDRFVWVKTKCSKIGREIRKGGGRGCVIIRTFTKFQKGVILKHGKVKERVFWRAAFYWFFCFVFIMIFLCAHVFQKKPLVNNIFLWLIVCLHFHWSIWREGFIFCVSFWS